ncbi:MAG: hypothetical protein E6F93_04075 [Actinobacteria bacterium]|nr:MAG: hypothetical protein E6F93_04075 [Actinomycetota bacterium]
MTTFTPEPPATEQSLDVPEGFESAAGTRNVIMTCVADPVPDPDAAVNTPFAKPVTGLLAEDVLSAEG